MFSSDWVAGEFLAVSNWWSSWSLGVMVGDVFKSSGDFRVSSAGCGSEWDSSEVGVWSGMVGLTAGFVDGSMAGSFGIRVFIVVVWLSAWEIMLAGVFDMTMGILLYMIPESLSLGQSSSLVGVPGFSIGS